MAILPILAVASCGRETADDAGIDQSESPRNVVWIVLDACRADHLSCYGYGRETSPNIDSLAARGVLFARNFAQGPNTPQSVQNYMTGRYSAVAYHYPGAMGDWFLRTPPPGEALVSTIFRENGFDTAMFSASPWYIAGSRLAQSFDRFQPLNYGAGAPGRTWRERNPELFDWIAQPHEKPFFLYIHSLDTHGPRFHNNTATDWLDPEFSAARDADLRAWLDGDFTADDRARLTDLYDGGVRFADESVGDILLALAHAGLAENTIVILGSDHGELLGEDGRTVSHPPRDSHDDLLHVPLIIAGPGVPEGVRIDSMTQNADIVPTLVEHLALETEATFDGASLAAVWRDTNESLRDYAVARTQGGSLAEQPGRVIVFDALKFHFGPMMGGRFAATFEPEFVYSMPDRAGARSEVTPSEAERGRAMDILNGELLPLWRVVEAQPEEVPPWFRLQLGQPFNREAVSPRDDPADDLWTRRTTRFASDGYNDAIYVAHASTESVPELILAKRVPNGEYRVSAYCVTLPADPPRGASFGYVLPDADETRRFAGIPAPPAGQTAEAWLDLGTVAVKDGRFRLTVGAGHDADDAVIGHLVFRTTDAEAPIEEFERLRQEMEALGYAQ